MLVLGGSLGWLYAPRAARPGTLNGAGTAGRITALAVPLGALMFSLLLLLGSIADSGVGGFADFGVPEMVGGVLGIALVGLLLFGLPMAGLTFVVASIRSSSCGSPSPVSAADNLARLPSHLAVGLPDSLNHG